MSRETEHRRDLARRISDHLAARTALRASLLTGSTARGECDEHSDLDLINYYDELPAPAEFEGLMRELGAELEGESGPLRREGFGSSYRFEGVEVQTGGTLVAATEERVARIATGDVDWILAKVAMGLLEGVALHGEDLIRSWQQRLRAYPDELRRREVERNLGVFPSWALEDHLAARDAELFRRQMLLDGAFRVLAVLSAVNGVYFTSFQFKRMRAHIGQMRVAPHRLAERLERVAAGGPEAAGELHRLVDEVKAIVSAEMPDVDTAARWRPL